MLSSVWNAINALLALWQRTDNAFFLNIIGLIEGFLIYGIEQDNWQTLMPTIEWSEVHLKQGNHVTLWTYTIEGHPDLLQVEGTHINV